MLVLSLNTIKIDFNDKVKNKNELSIIIDTLFDLI